MLQSVIIANAFLTFFFKQIENVLHPGGAAFRIGGDEDVAVRGFVIEGGLKVFRGKTHGHQKPVLIAVFWSKRIQCHLLALAPPSHFLIDSSRESFV